MKRMMIIIGLCSIPLTGFADANSSGMAQCISMSANAALTSYAQNHKLFPIPSVLVTKSDGSPSNGIDIKVTINNSMVYYVIASPIGGGPSSQLSGCSNAQVIRVSPIGG